MKSFYKELSLKTDQNNLLDFQENLSPYVEDFDFFSITDLTQESFEWVKESGIQNGLLTLQALHTTCVVAINELDEPCLLGDLNRALREFIPKARQDRKPYLHNSGLRTKNLCEDDYKCDTNADAHMKSFLFGSPSQSVIIRDGKPVWGTWQRLCLIDLDGPRERRAVVQIIGE
ncbi:MAG: secondary thiamine-phosphate synthase enzyme YjbQ [Deltaproteobacteria bacterium]|nr:secondary thiamine-phosphate synthase enzyme YjbQ [Deltaproteobacteria bacterium]